MMWVCIYINILACVRVKWGESQCFRIDNSVRKVVPCPLDFFSVHMDAVMKQIKMGMVKVGVRYLEEGRTEIVRRIGRGPEGDGRVVC